MAAGLPIFLSLWGRDPLTASWQSAIASPAMLRGTLPEIASWQGTEINDWYDEQPGRMIHEVHGGLLAELDIRPEGRYYSSITASTFYPVAVPAIYPKANAPQAWSASSIFLMVQSMLGLYPYAPLNLLLVDPQLPEWLPDLTLRQLRVGDAAVTLRFTRKDNGESTYEVLDKQGSLHVVRQASPWSLTASYSERVKDILFSLLPHK